MTEIKTYGAKEADILNHLETDEFRAEFLVATSKLDEPASFALVQACYDTYTQMYNVTSSQDMILNTANIRQAATLKLAEMEKEGE